MQSRLQLDFELAIRGGMKVSAAQSVKPSAFAKKIRPCPHHAPLRSGTVFRKHKALQKSSTCAASTQELAAGVWQRYCFALLTNPVPTKAGTSLVGFILGDLLAQTLEGNGTIDPLRMARLGIYGLTLDGPVGHMWYRWLDTTVDNAVEDSKGWKAILIKTAADQLIWAPVMTCVFFVVLKALEGHPDMILPTIQQRVLPTLLINYALWPAAHIISFKFVPSEQRVLYNNVIAIAWNCYLSMTVGADLTEHIPQDELLPSLAELANRISATLPHHYWLTDYLDKVGVDSTQVKAGVEKLLQTELPMLRRLVMNAINQDFSSAALAEIHVDTSAHLMSELQRQISMLR